MALNKKAVHSSQHQLGAAGRAVDGNRDSTSCSCTDTESNPWWRVDLQYGYKITAVTITNIDDNQHEDRLDGAEIWIGDLETNDTKKIR